MQIDIQAKGFVLTKELRRSIQKRIHHSFRFHRRRMRKVVVRLFNHVGTHGESIKSCRIQAVANGIPQLITEKKSNSLLEAINNSVSTSSRSITKHIQKLKNFRHVQSQLTNRSFA